MWDWWNCRIDEHHATCGRSTLNFNIHNRGTRAIWKRLYSNLEQGCNKNNTLARFKFSVRCWLRNISTIWGWREALVGEDVGDGVKKIRDSKTYGYNMSHREATPIQHVQFLACSNIRWKLLLISFRDTPLTWYPQSRDAKTAYLKD